MKKTLAKFFNLETNYLTTHRDQEVSRIVHQHQINLDSDDTLNTLLSEPPLPIGSPDDRRKRRRLYPRVVRTCVDMAQNKWGLPKDIPANRMMLRKFLGDHLAAHGMRPSHIASVLPIAVELSFVPSIAMIEAQEIAACGYVLDSARSYNGGIVAVDGTLVRPGEGP
jgi:hypothetical protein